MEENPITKMIVDKVMKSQKAELVIELTSDEHKKFRAELESKGLLESVPGIYKNYGADKDAEQYSIAGSKVIITIKEEVEDKFNFTTDRPKQFGYYFVKWSPEEKPIKVYVRYYPESGGESPHYQKEYWTWAVDAADKEPEDIEVDVTYPELIQFSERTF